MPRLFPWPRGLQVASQELTRGPSSISSGTGSFSAFAQTVSSPFGLWTYSFQFPPMRDEKYRAFRGMAFQLDNGANAVIWNYFDRDRLNPSAYGARYPNPRHLGGAPWSNQKTWANGRPWGASLPWAAVSEAYDAGSCDVELGDVYWGHSLGEGDIFGFTPNHFGKYMIREVVSPGHYKVWPPLRKAIKPSDFATLTPSLAMRAVPSSIKFGTRDASIASGCEFSLFEVEHQDVSRFYTR